MTFFPFGHARPHGYKFGVKIFPLCKMAVDLAGEFIELFPNFYDFFYFFHSFRHWTTCATKGWLFKITTFPAKT